MKKMYAINHCQMRDKIQAKMTSEDFQEEVMGRVEEIINGQLSGKASKPHALSGVELVAQVVAEQVKSEGARQVSRDVGVDLDRLIEQAQSQHISSC